MRDKISNKVINGLLKIHWIPRAAIGIAVIAALAWFTPHSLSFLIGFLACEILMLILILMLLEKRKVKDEGSS